MRPEPQKLILKFTDGQAVLFKWLVDPVEAGLAAEIRML